MADAAATGFYRTTVSDCVLGGVCGGVARQFRWPTSTVRILWVVVTLFLFGTGAVVYLVLWLVTPSEEQVTGRGRAPVADPGPVYR